MIYNNKYEDIYRQAVKLIFKKEVEISLLKDSKSYDDYNRAITTIYGNKLAKSKLLTKKEYSLLLLVSRTSGDNENFYEAISINKIVVTDKEGNTVKELDLEPFNSESIVFKYPQNTLFPQDTLEDFKKCMSTTQVIYETPVSVIKFKKRKKKGRKYE